MTANVLAADRDRCLKAGMNDYVAKPIVPDELYRVLLRWIPPKTQATPSISSVRIETVGPEIPSFPQVDTKLGLQRSLGNPSLYLKLLRRFGENQAQLVPQLQAALAAQDLITAQRLIHTAQGLCGNIGATQLQLLARELEIRMTQGEFDLLDGFTSSFQTLLNDLQRAFPPEEPLDSVVPEVPDFATVKGRLMELLDSNDPDSLEYLFSNRRTLKSALDTQTFRTLENLVTQFDFGKALSLLQGPR